MSPAEVLSTPAGSRRVRVAHVVTRLIAGAGGVAVRSAIELDRTRFESVIVTAPGGTLIQRAGEAGLEVLTLRHMRPDIAVHHDLAGVRELSALLDIGRFDIVHTHSAKAGALGRIAARRAGVPIVVHTFHGFPFHDFQSPLRRRTYVGIERRLGRITDRFVAVSSSVAAEAVRLGIAPAERVRVIPVSIWDPPSRPASRRTARRLLGVPDAARALGSVGRLDHQKAPLHFLEALAALRHRDVIGVWIGDGPLRKEVEQRAANLGLERRLRLLGERQDVEELLPGLDVFVMTSLYEGLPCAVVEAMRHGLPVVATAVNGVPELVIAGETGLLAPPARPRASARAVEHLLDHPAEAKRMAEAGRRLVKGRFSAEQGARALAELYLESMRSPEPLAELPRAS
jgi:glycosyltransferase involved in cell wall biosynthesis